MDQTQKGLSAPSLAAVLCIFFLIFAGIPVMFMVCFHTLPTLVMLVVVLGLMTSALPCLNAQHRLLGAAAFFGCVVATIAGFHGYFVFVQPTRMLENKATYNDVVPTEPAAGHLDAAIINFAEGTSVDDTKTVGLKVVEGGYHTYCVAPIFDASQDQRVQY